MSFALTALAVALPLAASAQVGAQTCGLLLQFEDDPGFLADSAAAQHAAQAQGDVSPTSGRFGGGGHLGPGGWIDAGSNFGMSFSSPRQTISVWLRPDEAGLGPGERRFIVGSREAPARSSWRWNLVIQEDGLLGFRLYDGQLEDPVALLTAPERPEPGRWTHVAVTIDIIEADAMRLFVDGVQVAEHALASNSPFGRLYLGGAAPQGFIGDIDELAIFDEALPAQDVLALAQAQQALPVSTGDLADQPEGFALRPITGMHYVIVTHSTLPETRWMLRIPEHTYADGDRRAITSEVVWQRGEEPQGWRFRWAADDEEKLAAALDFEGTVVARGDVVEYALTARNVGEEAWDSHSRLGLFCFKAPESPDLVDYEAERTWVRRDGAWVAMGEVVNHEFAEHRMCGIGVGDGEGQAEAITAKFTVDGRYVVAMATRPARSLSFNFTPTTNCQHSNPAWRLLAPGEEQTVTGRIWLIEGTLDDVYQRYQAELARD